MWIAKPLKERCPRYMLAPSTLNIRCTLLNNEYKTIRFSVVILNINAIVFLNFPNLYQFIYVFYISMLMCFYISSIRIRMIKNPFVSRNLFQFFSIRLFFLVLFDHVRNGN